MTPLLRKVQLALGGWVVVWSFGCKPAIQSLPEEEKPQLLVPHDQLLRATYLSHLVCGKSSWSADGSYLLFSKEAPPAADLEDLKPKDAVDVLADLGIWMLDLTRLKTTHELRNMGARLMSFGALGNIHCLPDGVSCLYQWGAGHVAVTRLRPQKSDYEVVKSGSIIFGSACPSPDGMRVAYMARTRQFVTGNSGVGLVRIEMLELGPGFQPTDRVILLQPSNPAFQVAPFGGLCFSADGKSIYFVGTTSTHTVDIYELPIAGKGIRRVTDFKMLEGLTVGGITCSPDGQWLACTMLMSSSAVQQGSTSGVWLVRTDGTGLRQLVRGGAFPAWSSDGNRLSFVYGGDLWICSLSQDALLEGAVTRPTEVADRGARSSLMYALRAASNDEYAQAIEMCRAIGNDPSAGDLLPKGLYLSAQWQLALGKREEAREAFQNILERHRCTEEAIFALKGLEVLYVEDGLEFDLQERLIGLTSEYARVEGNSSDPEELARVSYLQALAWDREIRGEIAKALQGYRDTVRKVPNALYARKAGLRAASCELTMGREDEAVKWLEWVEKKAGPSDEGMEALTQLLRIHCEQQNLKGVVQIWKKLRHQYTPMQNWWAYSVTQRTLIDAANLAYAMKDSVLAEEILNFCLANPPVDLGNRAVETRNALIGKLFMQGKTAQIDKDKKSQNPNTKENVDWSLKKQKKRKKRR